MLRNLVPAWCLTNSGALQISLAKQQVVRPSWIDFNRPLTKKKKQKKNDVAAVRRDEANNNTQRPRHLLMWPQSLEWCLASCVPKWNPWNYRCSRDPSSKNYFSSLTHFSFFNFSSIFTKVAIRTEENGKHPRHAGKERETERKVVREGQTLTAHLHATGSMWPRPLSFPSHLHLKTTGGDKEKATKMISHECCGQLRRTSVPGHSKRGRGRLGKSSCLSFYCRYTWVANCLNASLDA